MKTAIIIPDELFVIADDFAKSMDMSRSEFYAVAIREYIANNAKTDLVERINAACKEVDTPLPEDTALAARQRLLEIDW